MFTGIVEELGTVRAVTPNEGGVRLTIAASTVLDDVEMGASIAVNGCCLTVVAFDAQSWSADAVIETLARTNLGDLVAGAAAISCRGTSTRRERCAVASRCPTARRWSRSTRRPKCCATSCTRARSPSTV
jgi:hypothetical protein